MKKNSAAGSRRIDERSQRFIEKILEADIQILFMKVTLVIGFFAINLVGIHTILVEKSPVRGWLDIFSSLTTVACWFILKTKKGYTFCSHMLLTGLMISAWVSFYFGSVTGAGKFFPFLFPILAFFLNNRPRGTLWCLMYLAGETVLLFLNRSGRLPAGYSVQEVEMRMVNLVILSVMSYFISFRHDKMMGKLYKQIYYDKLTKLPNRNSLMEDLSEGCNAVFIISLDDFKEINALFGYETGDIILRRVTTLIEDMAKRYRLNTYRLSGSEFALRGDSETICEKHEYEKIASLIIHEIHDQSLEINEKQINLHISIGIGYHEQNYHLLLHYADLALKFAKKSHARFSLIESSEQSVKDYEQFLHISSVLHHGIEFDKIYPHFQPIFSNETGELHKYEALIRLSDELGTVYQPAAFLDFARRTHIYSKLTRIMLRKVIRAMHHNSCRFSINISYEDLSDHLTNHLIIKTLKREPQLASRLTFEILESESIEDKEKASAIIHELSALGCSIAIDDFGSGYANFDYLVHFKFDYLKIDGSLIRNIDHDENSETIVENIISYARKRNIKTVAEFVHSPEVLAKVKTMGIDYSQGFYLGRPGPLPALSLSPVGRELPVESQGYTLSDPVRINAYEENDYPDGIQPG